MKKGGGGGISGKDVIRELNRLGMMVDVSHVSDKTFYDAVEVSRAPVIASHSCARALSASPRNLSDEQLLALKANGGVVQICILGDYNIAPEDRDVHDPKAWEGSVHVSPAERAALQELLAEGLTDCFRLFDQPPNTFSWWDYRQLAFPKNRGLRIDHILLSEPLAVQCRSSRIDRNARKGEKPSDHAPALVELALR